jgi:hypothetical protein
MCACKLSGKVVKCAFPLKKIEKALSQVPLGILLVQPSTRPLISSTQKKKKKHEAIIKIYAIFIRN